MNKERFREIIFLVGYEFTSEEIAGVLCLSRRTIEDYRRKISDVTKTKSTVGLVKYAIEQDILDDGALKKKFNKALLKRINNM